MCAALCRFLGRLSGRFDALCNGPRPCSKVKWILVLLYCCCRHVIICSARRVYLFFILWYTFFLLPSAHPRNRPGQFSATCLGQRRTSTSLAEEFDSLCVVAAEGVDAGGGTRQLATTAAGLRMAPTPAGQLLSLKKTCDLCVTRRRKCDGSSPCA